MGIRALLREPISAGPATARPMGAPARHWKRTESPRLATDSGCPRVGFFLADLWSSPLHHGRPEASGQLRTGARQASALGKSQERAPRVCSRREHKCRWLCISERLSVHPERWLCISARGAGFPTPRPEPSERSAPACTPVQDLSQVGLWKNALGEGSSARHACAAAPRRARLGQPRRAGPRLSRTCRLLQAPRSVASVGAAEKEKTLVLRWPPRGSGASQASLSG